MKKTRKKRTIVKWQTNDQGADPLTERGKKWIAKEIAACNKAKLRKQLEEQSLDNTDALQYSEWMELHGFRDKEGNIREPYQANPDKLSDEDVI